MAIPAGTIFEIQTGGNDTNGGGFVIGASGTDFSQVTTKRTGTGSDDSTTDVVVNGTSTITSATANFTAACVGNIIYLQGGTASVTATWRQIVSRTNATTVVLDAAVGGSGTGTTMNIGGCYASIGVLNLTNITNGGKAYIKAGSYTINTTSLIGGGILNKNIQMTLEGYQTTRGDLGTPPVLTASGISSFIMINLAQFSNVINITLDGATLSTSRGLQFNGIAYKVFGTRFTNSAFAASSQVPICLDCRATACTTQPAFNLVTCYGCVASACTTTPFSTSSAGTIYSHCIAYANTGASTRGFNVSGNSCLLINCVSYGNGENGFHILTGNATQLINCIAEANTGVGFNIVNVMALLIKCATQGNGTPVALGSSTLTFNIGAITGSGSFFTAAGSGDFSLNNTAGRGALLRETAVPTPTFMAGLTANYLDIGAAQHQGGGSAAAQVGYSF